MNETEIITRLRDGFDADGRRFRPVVCLQRVDEPEFGCEGRPEEGPIYGEVWGYTENGAFHSQVEDWKIFTWGLDDNTWIGTPEGEEGVFVWSPRKQRLWRIPENPITL